MNLFRLGWLLTFAVCLSNQIAFAADFECAAPSKQAANDVSVEISGKAETLLKIGGADVKGTVQKTVVDLFSKYPNADRVAIINTLMSTTCNIIRNSTQLSDSEKLDKWMALFPAIQSLMPTDKKSELDIQNQFLRKMSTGTTYKSLVQVFGEPEEDFTAAAAIVLDKRVNGLKIFRFRTADQYVDMYLIQNNRTNKIVSIMLTHIHRYDIINTPKVNALPFLRIDKDLGSITFADVIGNCPMTEAEKQQHLRNGGYPDARDGYFVIGPCVFGYHQMKKSKEYFFGFNFTQMRSAASESCLSAEYIEALGAANSDYFKKCPNAAKVNPLMAMVLFDAKSEPRVRNFGRPLIAAVITHFWR